ncbi:putative membrane protein/domain [Frankia torreyi]|uniref:Putative membrane protein/domain n=2 Tax=Frankia TaxID=1854 RepID=A0A0D8BIE8_9ACTN|nr:MULTISPECIES: RDD family protein [Frankia]KJE23764.1 putative membrane protein/domain [Frankia torreyi]
MNQVVRSGPSGAGHAGAPGAEAIVAGEAIVTGEAVAIDLRVARLGSRLVAGLIDLLAQLYILYVLGALVVLVVRPEDDALVAAIFLLVYLAMVLGYPVACETLSRGRTLGKMALGLRVVRDDGGPIRFRHAFTRGLIGAVVERPGPLLGLPAIISMISSRHSKRLGDVFAGTVVLQVSVPRTVGAAPFVPPPLLGWASLLDLTGLDDGLALRARQFLSRSHALSPQALDRLGRGLVDEVRAVVTPPPPPGTPGWAYLSAVLAERTRRAYARLAAQRPLAAPPGVAPPRAPFPPPPGASWTGTGSPTPGPGGAWPRQAPSLNGRPHS